MSGVFRNIEPPTPSPPVECVYPPPRHWCGQKTHSLGGEGVGWGVSSSEDARHCSVLYICKYFVLWPLFCMWYFIGLAFHWLLRQIVKLKAFRIFNELMLSGRRIEIKLRSWPLRQNWLQHLPPPPLSTQLRWPECPSTLPFSYSFFSLCT